MEPDQPRAATPFKIRHFQSRDTPGIQQILLDSPEAAQWPMKSYVDLADLPGAVLLVSEANSNNQLLGFLAARQTADEAEILNIAVHPESRRKGIASALLAAALAHFERFAVTNVFLELRESNNAAAALYSAHGFQFSNKRKAYYKNPTEDALCMRKNLTGISL
jgi:ribosomal-protein-alanine N-acetyltransferase